MRRTSTLLLAGAIVGAAATAAFIEGMPRLGAAPRYFRLESPRLPPVTVDNATEQQKQTLQNLAARPNNAVRMCLHNPELCRKWWDFTVEVSGRSATARRDAAHKISLRDRELLIIYVNVLCHDDYPYGQHVRYGEQEKMSAEEIARIPKGLKAKGWNDKDAALIKAADELHKDYVVSDETWRRLSKYYNAGQLVDIVFTIGQYHLMAMHNNSVGTPLETTGDFPRLPR
jgi:4-carboxymuconolactone decarboxylase